MHISLVVYIQMNWLNDLLHARQLLRSMQQHLDINIALLLPTRASATRSFIRQPSPLIQISTKHSSYSSILRLPHTAIRRRSPRSRGDRRRTRCRSCKVRSRSFWRQRWWCEVEECALVLFRIADEGGDVVGGEEGVGEDFWGREGEVGDGGCAEGDLVEVGGEEGCHDVP